AGRARAAPHVGDAEVALGDGDRLAAERARGRVGQVGRRRAADAALGGLRRRRGGCRRLLLLDELADRGLEVRVVGLLAVHGRARGVRLGGLRALILRDLALLLLEQRLAILDLVLVLRDLRQERLLGARRALQHLHLVDEV